MKNTIAITIFALVSGFTALAQDQDQKERGNTDYTNNRSSAESKQQDVKVNTEYETPVKIMEFIYGTWTIEQVKRGQKDISASDTTSQEERIEFNPEGRYTSYSGNERIDSGAYRINEQQAILYMESETARNTSEWNVWFKEEGTMTLKLRDGPNHGERFTYIYRKVRE